MADNLSITLPDIPVTPEKKEEVWYPEDTDAGGPLSAPSEPAKEDIKYLDYWVPEGYTAEQLDEVKATPSISSPGLSTAIQGGLLMGGGDEVFAAGVYLTSRARGKSHDEAKLDAARQLKADREQRRVFTEEHPAGAAALEIIPAIATGYGAVRAAAKIAPKAAAKAYNWAKESPYLAAGTAGAGGGVLVGALEGESIEDRAKKAGVFGLTGLVFGPAGRLLGDVSSAGWQYVKRMAGYDANDRFADRIIHDALKKQNLTIDEVAPKLKQYADRGLTIADIDELFQQIARESTERAGPGRRQASRFLQERAANRSGRISDDVRELISGGDYFESRAAAMQTRKANAQPLYEKAWGIQPVMDEKIVKLLTKSPTMREVFNKARVKYQDEFREDLPQLYREIKPGIYELGTAPDAKTLHHMKTTLDDLIANNKIRNASGNDTGRLTPDGVHYQKLKNDLLGWMDESIVDRQGNKLYKEARDSYAGDSAIIDAMDRGTHLYKIHPSILVEEFKKLDPSEQDAFRIGVVKAIEDKISDSVQDRVMIRRILGDKNTGKARKQLEAIFGNKPDFDEFKNRMVAEIDMIHTEQTIPTKLQQTGMTNVGSDFYPATEQKYIPNFVLKKFEPTDKESYKLVERLMTPGQRGVDLLKIAQERSKPGALSRFLEASRPAREFTRPASILSTPWYDVRTPPPQYDVSPFSLPEDDQR